MIPLFIYSYIADLIFGDPELLPHPVRAIGKLIAFLEKKLQAGSKEKVKELIKGVFLAFTVIGASVLGAYSLIRFSYGLNYLLGNLIWVYLGYTTISVKDLFLKARGIQREIEAHSLDEARRQLSGIVGRDTQSLPEEKITGATIETIAESTNDGIIAPIFYLILGGPVLAVAYKAINTLDSMVGYKNEKYMHFGWFSAKIDDVANFIPARITGILMPVASFLMKRNFTTSFKIMLRDGRKHPSPNSGISEAAMAGALGVQLGGQSTYQGKICVKPYIGEKKKPITSSLINEALWISFLTSLLMVLAGLVLKCIR